MTKQKKTRLDCIKKVLQNVDGKILDVGCSEGKLHAQLTKIKPVYGLDILPASFPNFVRGSAHHFPFKSNSFSLIVAGELIEHLTHPELFVEDCFRTLKSNGILVLTMPNVDSWWNYLTLRQAYMKGTAHVRLFNEKQIRLLVDRCGLTTQEVTYVPFNEHAQHLRKLRRVIHNLMPQKSRDNMIVEARKP